MTVRGSTNDVFAGVNGGIGNNNNIAGALGNNNKVNAGPGSNNVVTVTGNGLTVHKP